MIKLALSKKFRIITALSFSWILLGLWLAIATPHDWSESMDGITYTIINNSVFAAYLFNLCCVVLSTLCFIRLLFLKKEQRPKDCWKYFLITILPLAVIVSLCGERILYYFNPVILLMELMK